MLHFIKLADQKLVFKEIKARLGEEFTDEEIHAFVKQWRRIRRPIFWQRWRVLHNTIAHPVMGLGQLLEVMHVPGSHRLTALGVRLHTYTEQRMYEPRGPEMSDHD